MPLLIITLGIALQIFLTYKKISPFISLLIVAITVGLLLGMKPEALIKSVEVGVGSTLGGLALIIALGAILGKLLEESGAIGKISSTLINAFGKRHVQWAVLLTGFLVGLPLYYNAGFVLLVPLIFSVAKNARVPLLYVAIPTAASLSATHCFLPPHPGPVVLVNQFGADLGKTLMYGFMLVIPIAILAGPFLGRILKNIEANGNESIQANHREIKNPPSASISFVIALMPVILISIQVIVKSILDKENPWTEWLSFPGDPTIALLISVLVAIYFFGVRRNQSMQTITKWLGDGISTIAVILLIITAGGVLKQVVTDSGTGEYIKSLSQQWTINPLLFGWIVTALLRVAIGSATVAGLTAVGIVAPLLANGQVSKELMVLSVGAGSIFGSHVNDSGFWMFKEFFGLSLKQTFLSWTVMETWMSLLGLAGVLLLQFVV